ncbi:MAG: endopeptidase La [bacterium]
MELINKEGVSFDTIPAKIPFEPLISTVIFPSMVAPIIVGKKRSILSVQKAMEGDNILASFLIKSGREDKEELTPEDIYPIGTAIGIIKMLKMPDNTMRILVQGIKKIKLKELRLEKGLYMAEVDVLPDKEVKSQRMEALTRTLIDKFKRIIALASYLPEDLETVITNIEEPLALVYLIASVTNMKIEQKQKILEIGNTAKKLELLLTILSKEEQLLELGGKIESEVVGELTKTQKEYFLKEQLRAIKKELGEVNTHEAEIEDLRQRIKKKALSKEVGEVAEKELKRLEYMPNMAPEYYIIRTYLETILELPWMEETEDNLNLARARRILDQDHYGLDEVKLRIIEYLAVRKLKKDSKGSILCFIGPPGVGKTSLGQSIARALGRKFMRISLGGIRDEAEIRGHRRTYVGALPGKLIQGIRRAGSNNPIFMLDEVDKVGADFRGDPSYALLEVLDPEQNHSFMDHYLDIPFDLSKVIFIATANVLQNLHPALRDRMEILYLPGYISEEKVEIAQKYLIPKQLKAHGLNASHIVFEKKALYKIISNYTQEAGVRDLERRIAKICRKEAHRIATKGNKKAQITPRNLTRFLGPQKIFPEVARRTSIPGVATGLAWTENGGEILFVEALIMPGKKGLNITGQLGDVMQESVKTALSYIRAIAPVYSIDSKFFDKYDIHVHVPAGAVPKDGPSAGIAIVAALVSILSGHPVRKDVALSGEITLSGIVLPVGGIREKVLAAKRAGIKTVILPSQNKGDISQIKEDLLQGLEIKYIEKINEALDMVLDMK